MQIEPLLLISGSDGPVHPYPKILESDVLEAIALGLGADYQRIAQQKIDPLECPVHHQAAIISIATVVYARATERFEGDQRIETCCEEFRQFVLTNLQ